MKTVIDAATVAFLVMFAVLSANVVAAAADANADALVAEEIRTCEIIPSIVDDAVASVVEQSKVCSFIRGATLDVDLLSSYVDPDVGAPIYNKEVVQATITVDLPAGFYVGMFVSSGLDSEFPDDDFSDEIDWFVGKIWTLPFGLELDTSVWWCDSQNLFQSRNDILWAQARLNITEWEVSKLTLRPYAYVTTMRTFGSSEYEGGVVGGAGFEGEVALYSEVLRLVFNCMVGYDDGIYGYQPGALTKAFVGIEYDVTDNLTFRLGGTVWYPLEDERETTSFAGVGLTWTF